MGGCLAGVAVGRKGVDGSEDAAVELVQRFLRQRIDLSVRGLTLSLNLGRRHPSAGNARRRRTATSLLRIAHIRERLVDAFEFGLDFDAFVSSVDSGVESFGGGFDDLFDSVGRLEYVFGMPVQAGAGRPRGRTLEPQVAGDFPVAGGDLDQGLADGGQVPVGVFHGAGAPRLHLVQPVGVRGGHYLPPHWESLSMRLRARA